MSKVMIQVLAKGYADWRASECSTLTEFHWRVKSIMRAPAVIVCRSYTGRPVVIFTNGERSTVRRLYGDSLVPKVRGKTSEKLDLPEGAIVDGEGVIYLRKNMIKQGTFAREVVNELGYEKLSDLPKLIGEASTATY